MPVFVSFLIPFITAGVLLFFFKKKVTTNEWLILIGSSIVFTLLVYLISKSISQSDTEYLGGNVTEIKYYEDWNERVRKSREVPCGTDKDGHTTYCTEYYWVTEYHPEYWVMITTLNKYEKRISKDVFERFKRRFNTKEQFIDMHRHYYTNDGDAYSWKWDGKRNTLIAITEENSYKNPLKNSNSIFRYTDIEPDSAKALGLYDYPKFRDYTQNPIIGLRVDSKTLDQFNYINCIYGPKYQIRVFILIYPANRGIVVSEMQKGYWQGGNKNELVVCLGVNKEKHVEWVNAFSWQDAPWIDVETRSWFDNHDSLDLYEYGVWLEQNIPSKWKRKEFKDFEYVKANMTNGAKWAVFILTFLFCCGFGIYLIENEFER